MIDPRKQAFLPYLRSLADRMGLRDWEVKVADEPPRDSSASAGVFLPYGMRYVKVHLGESFLDGTPEERRTTLVHELVHVHFAAASGMAEDLIGDGERKCWLRMFEYGIDAVAEAWAPSLPLRLAGVGP